jgi:hypothetical protein
MLLSRAFATSASGKRSLGAASASIGPGDHAAPEEARSRLPPAPSLLLREKRPVRSEDWSSSITQARDACRRTLPLSQEQKPARSQVVAAEVNDDDAVRRQIVEDTVSARSRWVVLPDLEAAQRTPDVCADMRSSSGPAARSASRRVAARSRERHPDARATVQAGSKLTVRLPTAAAADAPGCRGSAVSASPDSR